MKIGGETLAELAMALSAERKRQKLSREDSAAVCGVSTSFIRDAESHPENCTLGKRVKLINGLGLGLDVSGLELPPPGHSKTQQRLGITLKAKSPPNGRIGAATALRQADYGVPDSQLVWGPASLTPERSIDDTSKGEPS